VLLFPLDPNVHHKMDGEKSQILGQLEAHAHAAGLRGSAAIVWEYGRTFYSFGPRRWAAYLRSINMSYVWANVKPLTWRVVFIEYS